MPAALVVNGPVMPMAPAMAVLTVMSMAGGQADRRRKRADGATTKIRGAAVGKLRGRLGPAIKPQPRGTAK